MTAFPPIEELDNKTGSAFADARQFEEHQVNFMRVMDQHLASTLAKDPKNSVYIRAALGGRAPDTH